MEKHICIVGGGINGLLTAYYLKDYYKKITIVEKQNTLCSKSSYHNAGTLFYSRIRPVIPNYSIFKNIIKNSKTIHLPSIPFISKWVCWNLKNNIDYKYNITTHNRYKYDYIKTQSKIEFDTLINSNKQFNNIGLHHKIYLTFNNLDNFNKEIEGYRINRSNYIDGHTPYDSRYILLYNNYSCNTKNFANIIYNELLNTHNIDILTEREMILLESKNNKIIALNTNKEVIYADEYVLCTNHNHIKINKSGKFYNEYLPLIKISGLSWTFDKRLIDKINYMNPYNLNPADMFNYSQTYVQGDHNIFYSNFDNKIRITYGYFINTDKKYLINNYERMKPYFPYYNTLCNNIIPEICDRYVSPDGLPLIGRYKDYKNLYVNTGHGFIGWTLAPFSAFFLRKILLSNIKEYKNILSPQRFTLLYMISNLFRSYKNT